MLVAKPLDEPLLGEMLGKPSKIRFTQSSTTSTTSTTNRTAASAHRTTNTAPVTTNSNFRATTAAPGNDKVAVRLPAADAMSLGHAARRSMSKSRSGIGQTVKMAGKGTVKATQFVSKGTVKTGQVVGKSVGVAGKGATKLGVKTARGTISATKLVAKNTVRVGKGTVGAVGAVTTNLQGNAVVKGVAELGGNVIHLADTGINRIARTLKQRHDDEVTTTAASKTRMTAATTQIELVVECKNLRRKDAFAECDAFCVLWQVPSGYGLDGNIGKCDDSFSTLSSNNNNMISMSSISSSKRGNGKRPPRVNRFPTSSEKEVGRTEVVKGNGNPQFAHRFAIDFNFAEEQCFVLRVYDCDLEFCNDLKEHDFLGGTYFTMGELMGIGKRELRRRLRSPTVAGNTKSLVMIRGNEVTTSRSALEFRFSAHGLREGDKGVIEKEDDSFYEILKLNADDLSYQVVYKSEVKMHDNAPTWAKARLPLSTICDNNIATPLRINFYDWKRSEQAEPLGYVETDVNELVDGAKRGIPVMDVVREHKRLFRRDRVKKSGTFKVLRAELKPVPTMMEYICGGCTIDLMVAVDCSIHNRDNSVDGGLHHRPAPMWLNDYQAAINKIGVVLEPYSKDSEFTIWGFGGDIRGEPVPLFPMGDEDGLVHGAAGMLDAYDMTFVENPHYMEPAESANIEPLIQSAMYRAIKKSEREHCYSVLCILTAGNIGAELRETIDTLCTAAEDAPLSIVIIGVGENNAGLDAIRKIVANGGKLRHSNGVPIARDILGFAAFNDFDGNSGKVVAESLKDLPEQLVEYFSSSGIPPRPLQRKEDLDESMKDESRSSMGDSSRRRHIGRSDNRNLPGPRKSRSPKKRSK